MWNLILGLLLIRATLDNFFNDFRLEVGGADFSPGVLLNVLVLGVLALLLFKNRSRAGLPLLFWAPFLVLLAISIAHTPDRIGAIRLYAVQVTYFAFFTVPFLLPNTATRNDGIVDVLLISSVVPFVYGLYELATGFNSEFRAQSTFPHANIFAFYILIVMGGILYKVYNQQARPTVGVLSAYIGLLLVALGFLLLTQTRSAWIGFGVMFGIAALLIDKRLMLAGVLIPALLFVPAVQNRLEDTSSSTDLAAGEALSSYAWRQRLWEQAFDDLKGHDLLGKGLGAFHINSTSFSDLVTGDETTEAHSAYVQTTYENGWVGLSAFLWIYIACIGALLNSRRYAPAESTIGIVCVLAMLIVNYSDNTPYYLSYNWYAWSFVAFMICKCRAIQASKAAPFAQRVSRPSNLRQLRT